MENAKRLRGRPRLPDAERRVMYGISLSPAEIAALRAIAIASERSQGQVVGEYLLRAARRLDK